jgi:murein L,D-transpeptidase YcbB/YkuD
MNKFFNSSQPRSNPKLKILLISAGIVLVVGLLAFWAIRSATFQNKRSEESMLVMQSVLDTLQVENYFRDDFKRRDIHRQFVKFYSDRDYRLAWSTLKKPLPLADSLFGALQMARQEGLNPDDYNVKELKQMRDSVFQRSLIKIQYKRPDLLRLVQLDFQLTAAYLSYASHLAIGRINPQKLEPTWMINPQRSANLAANLEKALRNRHINRSLKELLPDRQEYQQLRALLVTYRKIEEQGGWPGVVPSALYRLGKKGEPVTALRRRLALSGDLKTATAADSALFDDSLAEALKGFQERHGLQPNGKVDEATIKALNEPVARQIDRIELNLERLRWLPEKMGEEYVLVNVPGYDLKVMNGKEKALQMRVVVGKEFNSTPIFRDTIEYIVFSPDWSVPMSIATKEILPIVQRDPQYLLANNYKVYSSWDTRDTVPLDPEAIDWDSLSEDNFKYRVVQGAGEGNALGSVKFMFPNKMDIYLHDTPASHLFKRNERAFSHGCVRVEKPTELAKYLLRDNNRWSEETIKEAMQQDKPETVKLPRKVPVFITYLTAYADDQGRLNLREDIYGHDSKQLSFLERKSARL